MEVICDYYLKANCFLLETGEPKGAGPGGDSSKRGGRQDDTDWWRRMQKVGLFMPWDDSQCALSPRDVVAAGRGLHEVSVLEEADELLQRFKEMNLIY